MAKVNRFFAGKTLGILTGGGDTPALNASIEALKARAEILGFNVYGIGRGWKGLLEEGDIVDLTHIPYDGWYGGTALRSSRTNPMPTKKNPVDRSPQVLQNLKRYGIDVLVTIGGDDTNGAARKLYEKEGIPVIGFPKTIDNDVRTHTIHNYQGSEIETCLCPGFPSAAQNVAYFTSKICTTARSHSRIMVLEVMGRDAGWLTGAATFGGAAMALIPEYEMTPDKIEQFYAKVDEMYKNSKDKYLILAVAEGTRWFNKNTGKAEIVCASTEVDEFGHPRLGGISGIIASDIEKRLKIETRSQVIGYYARSGQCSEYDKRYVNILADKALDLLLREDFGKMPVLKHLTSLIELEEFHTFAMDMGQVENKPLPIEYYDAANFNFSEKYTHFLGHFTQKPQGAFHSFDFPKVFPKA